MRSLYIPRSLWEQMRDHVNSETPLEACGLCSGKNAQVEKIYRVRNQAQSPVRFVMDPLEQLGAFESIESEQMDLLAIYHSHPAGPEAVSATDIAEAAYAVVHIVWSKQADSWQARGFWIEDGKVTKVALQVEK